jgi:hypothetical protein
MFSATIKKKRANIDSNGDSN